MRRGKNKTFYFLILGFVFLYLAYLIHSKTSSEIPTKETADTDSAQAEINQLEPGPTNSPETTELTGPVQAVITADSSEITHSPSASSGLAPFFTPKADAAMGKLKEEYFRVAKVVDGDTIDLVINGKTERLRLIGINTPEVVDPRKPVECFGREASDNAKKLLSGQEVRIEVDPSQDDRDKYGRLLRYVWRRDGLFYNLEAIEDGFAYEYTYQLPYRYQKEFKAAQKYAKDNEVGLWAKGVCHKDESGYVLEAQSSSTSLKNNKCLIKGNIGSDSVKIYHLPECSYYKQTVIDESQGEKWFCSEAEAIAAGWRKAKNCP